MLSGNRFDATRVEITVPFMVHPHHYFTMLRLRVESEHKKKEKESRWIDQEHNIFLLLDSGKAVFFYVCWVPARAAKQGVFFQQSVSGLDSEQILFFIPTPFRLISGEWTFY